MNDGWWLRPKEEIRKIKFKKKEGKSYEQFWRIWWEICTTRIKN